VCHNPYGVWHLGPPGGAGESLSDLEPVFMPPLSVLLMAAEKDQEQPLTQEQVEAIRDKGTCTMMKRRHAQKLERSRGYADLDPQLAWEQWRLLRERAESDED
jgi:hypothetical protein